MKTSILPFLYVIYQLILKPKTPKTLNIINRIKQTRMPAVSVQKIISFEDSNQNT